MRGSTLSLVLLSFVKYVYPRMRDRPLPPKAQPTKFVYPAVRIDPHALCLSIFAFSLPRMRGSTSIRIPEIFKRVYPHAGIISLYRHIR